MNIRWSPQRIDAAELLDSGQGSDSDVAENLVEMQRINDVLGGTRALTRYLYPRLYTISKAIHPDSTGVRILDIGTGGAGIPRRLAAWAASRVIPLRVIALDYSARVIAAAKACNDHARVHLLHADALCLPFAPGSVDFVVSSMFLHHLPPDGVIALLRSASEVARSGLVMSDLVRGRLPYMAFHAITPLFARNHLTRYDGALSVRRAYTPGELCLLAAKAGLRGASVHAHFPWRMTLVVDK